MLAYVMLTLDAPAASAPLAALMAACDCMFMYLGMATAAIIAKITRTAMISINVKPFSFITFFRRSISPLLQFSVLGTLQTKNTTINGIPANSRKSSSRLFLPPLPK
jgi:hypothetical protein